jgi:hypothetical protein
MIIMSQLVVNKLLLFAKRYPIPAFAILGLFVGALFHWPLDQSSLGQWIWFITLNGGGAPIVWDTFRGMLRKHFASDIVAMMAIVVHGHYGHYHYGHYHYRYHVA